MKHFFTIAVMILFLSVSCVAQIRFGVEAGVNYSMAEQDGWKLGYQVGISASKEFVNHLTLSTALSYQHVNLKMFMDEFTPGVSNHPENIRKLDELVLPLRIGYRFYLSDGFQLEPSAGIYGNYIFYENRWSELSRRATDHFGFGWIGGVKGIIANHFSLSLDYRMSFCNLGDVMPDKEHNILLSVGYLF